MGAGAGVAAIARAAGKAGAAGAMQAAMGATAAVTGGAATAGGAVKTVGVAVATGTVGAAGTVEVAAAAAAARMTALRFAWSVTPSLLAWPALMLPLPYQLVAVAGSLGLALGVDVRYAAQGLMPRWLMPLRFVLTVRKRGGRGPGGNEGGGGRLGVLQARYMSLCPPTSNAVPGPHGDPFLNPLFARQS